MSVSVDWKPERAVQAKIRDMNKNDNPDRLKTRKGDLCKSYRSKDKVTASGQAYDPLGAYPVIKEPPIQSICRSKTRNRGNSKLLGRTTVIVFNVPSLYIYHFPKTFKDPWNHAIGRLPLNSSNLSLCPFIWNSNLFYLHSFFYFLWQYLKQNFQNTKLFFYIFWKVWTTNTLSLNSWVVEAYINI